MMKRIFFILTLLTYGLVACDSNLGSDDQKEKTDDHIGNPEAYRNTLLEEFGTSDAPFSVVDVKRVGATKLEVNVKHPANCTGAFDLYGDGSVALSYPPQVYLVLRYDGECRNQELTTSTDLSFDLNDFIDQPDLDEDWIIHIINGSVSDSSNDTNTSSK